MKSSTNETHDLCPRKHEGWELTFLLFIIWGKEPHRYLRWNDISLKHLDTSENVSFWRAASSRKQSPETPFLSCNHFGLKYSSTRVSTRGWQSFSIKDQVTNILVFVGRTVCVGTAPLSHCRKQAAIENTATAKSMPASDQTLFMDVVFLKFYIFTCHKIVFFFKF